MSYVRGFVEKGFWREWSEVRELVKSIALIRNTTGKKY